MEKYEIRDKYGKKIGSIEETSGIGGVIIFAIVLVVIVCCIIALPFGLWFVLLPELVAEGGGTMMVFMIVPMIITILYKMKETAKVKIESYVRVFWSFCLSSTIVSAVVLLLYALLAGELTDSFIGVIFAVFLFSIAPALAGTLALWTKEKIKIKMKK